MAYRVLPISDYFAPGSWLHCDTCDRSEISQIVENPDTGEMLRMHRDDDGYTVCENCLKEVKP